MKHRQLIGRILLSLLILAGYVAWRNAHDSKPEKPAVASTGQADIGGPFALINQYGMTVSSEQLKGKYLLIFFAYSHCPDICPTTLLTMTNVINQLGEQANEVQPIMISVDPERDTPKILAEYAKNFHPNFQMLTGPQEAVASVLKAYRVFAEKDKSTAEGQWLVQHSGFIYLMDREGKYVKNFSYNTGEAEMLAGIKDVLQQDK